MVICKSRCCSSCCGPATGDEFGTHPALKREFSRNRNVSARRKQLATDDDLQKDDIETPNRMKITSPHYDGELKLKETESSTMKSNIL